jgi:hypothetical protein
MIYLQNVCKSITVTMQITLFAFVTVAAVQTPAQLLLPVP